MNTFPLDDRGLTKRHGIPQDQNGRYDTAALVREEAAEAREAVKHANMTAIIILPNLDTGDNVMDVFEARIGSVFGGFNRYSGVGGWVEGANAGLAYYPGKAERETHVRYEIAFVDGPDERAEIIDIARRTARVCGQQWLHIKWRASECEPINCQ